MEASVLIGLLGIGYFLNQKDDSKNPIDINVNKTLNFPSMENQYESDHYNQTQEKLMKLASENFEESQRHSNIINNQNVINHDNTIDTELSKYTYSNSAGAFISDKEFLKNDQGIEPFPFYSKAPANINFNDSRVMNRHQGSNEFYRSKTETSNFGDAFQKKSGNVFGSTFDSHVADTSRYEPGLRRTNELPFSQERISPIDQKSNFSREVGGMISQRSSVDNTRTLTNPKLSYGGKILAGKGHEQRGKQGDVYKHNPETYYDNNPDKWFVTNGAFLAKSERPVQLLPDTNRKFFNKQEFGPASPAVQENAEFRPNFKKSLKQQLGSDTTRNVGSEVPSVGIDLQQKGYRNIPNERQVTELRTYDSNLKTEVGNQTVGVIDPIKKTMKQTTLTPANNGYLGNNIDSFTQRQYDSVKVTKKQTTMESANNGYIRGYQQLTLKPEEAPEWTTKDTTHFDYTGNAGGYIKGDMGQDNFMNAETNPTKELISQGRAPTLNNVKVVNGSDIMNIDVKKIDNDYINHRLNGVEKVYGELPDEPTCKTTTTKDRLDDTSIANRIEPELLNPFRQNPFTQPLTSFSY